MTAFLCPACGQNQLEIEVSLELPAGPDWDENCFQLAACGSCDLRAAVVYQESHRGSLWDEAWQHLGVVIGQERYARIKAVIEACPAPDDRRCGCEAHQTLDLDAFWAGNPQTFVMRRE